MSARRGILPDGLIVGLIGYASVAVFYSVFDSIVVANVVAVILAGAYLLRRRSDLMHVFGIPSGAKRFNS